VKHHGVSQLHLPMLVSRRSRLFARTDMLMVQVMYIRTREFGSKRKFTRNVGTHFRCKPWTKFCPRSGPIKRYARRMNLYISRFLDGVLFSYSTVLKKWPLTEGAGWWIAECDDFKRGYWSRVEIPTRMQIFFSLIFVYKLISTNSYNYTNCIVQIHTIIQIV
jgi:hypothetical protein